MVGENSTISSYVSRMNFLKNTESTNSTAFFVAIKQSYSWSNLSRINATNKIQSKIDLDKP